MAKKKKDVPEDPAERTNKGAAPAIAEDLPEHSPEEGILEDPPATAESAKVPEEASSPVSDDPDEEEEYQDTVEAILARKRRMMEAMKAPQPQEARGVEKEPEEPSAKAEGNEASEATEASETTAEKHSSSGESEPSPAETPAEDAKTPLPVPERTPAAETAPDPVATEDTEDDEKAVAPGYAEEDEQSEPVADVSENETAPVPADAANPARVPLRFDRAPVGVAAMVIFAATALLAALLMGAAISYRYERTQRELMTQLTGALDSLKVRGNVERAPATTTEQPERDVPKTYDDYALILNEANMLFNEGRFGAAAERYRAALKAFPSGSLSDQAHYRLGVCLLRAGTPDNAAEHLRVVAESFPGSPYCARSALELSRIFIQREEYEQARRVLYRIIGSRARLVGEDAETLEKAYYALGRALEGEAEVVERLRAEQRIGLDSEANTGGTP